MTKILVTGAHGQVGWELRRTLAPLGEVIALDRSGMDLADPDSMRRAIRETKPDLIVNAAAYTAVDRAESERDLAFAVNAVAPGIMAEEAKRTGAALIHYSTDYVFDGEKSGPYLESDAPNPCSVYGASKLAGEQAIADTGARHLILRTSWIYGARGTNFLLAFLRLARERDDVPVVDDRIGAPTWSRMVAQASALIAAGWRTREGISGVYNLTAAGETSWHGFAQAVLALLPVKCELRLQASGLAAIASAQYPASARRPRNSLLSHAKLERDFDLQLPHWNASLRLCLDDLSVCN